MAEVLKAVFQLRAEAQKFKEAQRDAESLKNEVLELSAAYRRNVESSEEIRMALISMGGSVKEGSDEWRILHGDLDRVNTIMLRQQETLRELTREMGLSDDATEEQVQATQQLEDVIKDQQVGQEGLNQVIREGREETKLSTKATEETIVAEKRLVQEQEDSFVATKAQTTAIHSVATAKEQAKIETVEFSTAEGLLAQEQQASVGALKQTLVYTARMGQERESGLNIIRQTDAATHALGVEEKLLNTEVSESILHLRAQKQALHNTLVKEKELAGQTKILGIATDDLKKSLITAVAAGGVAGLVFKGMQIIGDAFRRAKDAVVEFIKASIQAFTDLQEELARTRAQIPELTQSLSDLLHTSVDVAKEIGRAPLEVATAFRKAQNLGLGYADSLKAIEVSTDAARVANADMVETLITGMTTVNAYGRGMYDITDVLDQYAYLTQNSNLETQDLISGMAAIISPAAEAGVSLEEVVAAMVVMNRQGDDFKEIGTLLGNMLTQIAVRGTTAGQAFQDAAGMGFREFTAAGGTLVEGLALIEQHAEDTNQSISELVQGNSKFYRDMMAGRGVLELTGRHAEELTEAYYGAQNATGSLAEQTEEFQGTLYLLNEEMEAAKAQSQAMTGEAGTGFATWWTKVKKNFYESVSEGAMGDMVFAQAKEIADASHEAFNALQLAEIIEPTDSDYTFAETRARMEETKRLYEETHSISLDEIEAALAIFQAVEDQNKSRAEVLEFSKEQLKVDTDIKLLHEMGKDDRQDAHDAEKALTAEKMEQADIARAAREFRKIEAAQRLATEDAILAKLQAQKALSEAAYGASKGFIDNISDLQLDLSVETDPAAIEELQTQLEEAGTAIDDFYNKSMVDAIISTEGFDEKAIDLAVHMGMITYEAGELQKEFIRVKTEIDKLAEIEVFQNLSVEGQKKAFEALKEGIAETAEEAAALFDPETWAADMTPGWMRAEEGFFDVTPKVEVPPEDLAKLTELETRLHALVETEWLTTVSAPPDTVEANALVIEEYIEKLTRDRWIYIGLTGPGADYDGDPDRTPMASGGSFTVPQGFMNDDYLIGVSSGEQVSVTSPGNVGSSGGGVTIELVQHFGAGISDPAAVAGATKDGLYEALEKAGLI